MKKSACVPGSPAAQADCKIGELLFHDCFNRAIVNAGAAVHANIGIDDVLAFALSDGLNGAVINAGAAADACVGNFVSHDIPSSICIVAHQQLMQVYSSMYF